MPRPWTFGVWRVKPGREEEFVAAWRELVPLGTQFGGEKPTLLSSREGSVFYSFGSWPDEQATERFRAQLRPRIGAMNELLEGFEASTLDEVYPGD
jgi:Antibiotic biosynthesis monooxygenase